MELTAEQIAANKLIADKKIADEKVAAELKALNKKEALRDLSKELGINAFEPAEIKTKFDEFTKWQTDQKSEQEKLQEKVDLLDKEKTTWATEKLDYASKYEAMRLNIADENIADAMKLAGGDPTKLEEVVKKYPVFKSKSGVKIGLNENEQHRAPGELTDTERYMAGKPKYKGYQPK